MSLFGHESHEVFGEFFSSQRKPNGRDHGVTEEVRAAILEAMLSGEDLSGSIGLGGGMTSSLIATAKVFEQEQEAAVKDALYEGLTTKAKYNAVLSLTKDAAERDQKDRAKKDEEIARLAKENRELRGKLNNAEAAKMVAESNERLVKSQLQIARDARDEYIGQNVDLSTENCQLNTRLERLEQLVGDIRIAISVGATLTTEDISGAVGRATNLNYRGKKFLRYEKPAPAATNEPEAPAAPAAEPENAETAKAENPLAGLGPEGLTNGDF